MNWPRYSEYRESHSKYLGEVPAHWIEMAAKRAVSSGRRGGGQIKGRMASEFQEGLYPGYSASGQDVWVESFEYDKPGIVLSAVGARCGKCFKADGRWTAIANTHVLLPEDGFERDFLWYVVNDEGWWEKGGTAQPYVRVPTSLRKTWAFPPKDEQRTIAAFLDRESARIDALIEKKRRLLELLEEQRLAIIIHAVTKGLEHDVPMKDSGIEWLGAVPAHWDVARVKFVATLESGHTPSKSVPEYWEDCDIPWVSLNDSKFLAEHDFIYDTTYMINQMGLEGSSARLLPKGAVVFTRDATIGLTAVTAREMAVSQHLIAWLPKEGLLSKYLLRVFDAMKKELDRFTFGATIKTIGMDDVKRLVTPVPPFNEQEAICEYIEEQQSGMVRLSNAVSSAIERLAEYRSALITNAITGKIDVRNLAEEKATA